MYVAKVVKDNPQNVLLEGVKITDDNAEEFSRLQVRLENLEEGIIGDPDIPRVQTDAGMKLLESNISGLNPFDHESDIQAAVDFVQGIYGKINTSRLLIDSIYSIFISRLDFSKQKNKKLERLGEEKARMFYAMFLDWRIQRSSYSQMINRMMAFWNEQPADALVYVDKWGELKSPNGGYSEHYIKIWEKTPTEKVNYAIVRIKEEEDFFDYHLFRFIEIMNELELLDESFYLRAKYGTDDQKVISLIRNGFSRSFAELLLADYSEYFWVLDDDRLHFNPEIRTKLEENGASFIQLQEIALNIPE